MSRLPTAIAALLLAAVAALAATRRLPMRHYTAADGLPQDHVQKLAADDEGFLWIATAAGLSRFDGQRFVNFGEADGLRGRMVNDVAFSPDGTGWAATEAGLFVFRPGEVARPGRLFANIPLEGVPDGDEPHRVLASKSGDVWVGTMKRLWRVRPGPTGTTVVSVELLAASGVPLRSRIQSLREDPDGDLWIGTHLGGIYRIARDGRVDHCHSDTAGTFFVRDFYFPGDGSVLMSYLGGVAVFDRPPFPGKPIQLLGTAEGLSIDTGGIAAAEGGGIVVGTSVGMIEVHRDASGRWHAGATLDSTSGLPADAIGPLLRDATGTLWMGVAVRGLVKMPPSEFETRPDAEVPGGVLVDLTPDRRGRIVAICSKGVQSLYASYPEGDPQGAVQVSLPGGVAYVGWGMNQKVFCDSRGSWWVAIGEGVLRYDDPSGMGLSRLSRPPDAVFSLREGMAGRDAFIVDEDAHGDVWISSQPAASASSSVSRWSRATGRLETFPASAVGTRSLAVRFLTTRDDALWIAFMDRRVVRFRNGRFEPVEIVPGGAYGLRGVEQDGEGRVWIVGDTTYVCDDPRAEVPRFVRRPVEGEAGRISCMVEDGERRLWFGTALGLVRFDPATGQVRRYTRNDGLVSNSISSCERDGAGDVWFSDRTGLSRFLGRAERAPALAEARLREIRVAGAPVPLPVNGATSVAPLVVPANARRLSVEFFAAHQTSGAPPSFQYRLEGADRAWSAPAADVSVNYAGLSPGRYRFAVRTVGEDGESGEPAVIPLRVLAPVWRRPWFVALGLFGIVGALYAAHRIRVSRILAAERIRTRIATDLHDDIGSSLSQISILSQLAHRQVGQSGSIPPEALTRITAVSGEVIDAMSDVVWAISPRWDTVSALVHRMRRFASELFADGTEDLTLSLPDADDGPVDADVRRQLYLVFKEALHNVRRHASARRVAVTLRRPPGGGWLLSVEDDGKGFDPLAAGDGHGLRSMRRRAEELGGTLAVGSSQQGTKLTLTLPAHTNLSNG
jgi:signal transduction histidine kinase/ligand-binding sensor domain-containing protein